MTAIRPFWVSLTLTVRDSFRTRIALNKAQHSKPCHHLGSSRSAHPQHDGKLADGQGTMAVESLKHLLLASKQAQTGELRVQVSAVQRAACVRTQPMVRSPGCFRSFRVLMP